jgi:hypothetical protein
MYLLRERGLPAAEVARYAWRDEPSVRHRSLSAYAMKTGDQAVDLAAAPLQPLLKPG